MFKFNCGVPRYITCIIYVSLVFFCEPLKASPWLETDDIYLRSDLQLLADAGVITIPVNTFPLPWRNISNQIQKISTTTVLNKNIRHAYDHVLYKINASKKGYGSRSIQFKASTKSVLSSFGNKNDVEWGAFSNVEVTKPSFAMRISTNYGQYHDKTNPQSNFNHSYFAVTTGETNFFLNTQSQWWSPSWIQSLSAEHRIHPAYELGLERTFIDFRLLGDVYFKTGINQLRGGDDWKYSWRSRLSVRPTNSLELSFSRFDFKEAQNSSLGEHSRQFSMDGRLSLLSIVDLPLAFYSQYIIDDSQADFSNFLLGSDYTLFTSGNQIRFIFEFLSTDYDDLRYSFGSHLQMENDHQWELFLHHDRKEQVNNQLVGRYRFLIYKGMLSLSLMLSDAQDKDKINAGLSWELRF